MQRVVTALHAVELRLCRCDPDLRAQMQRENQANNWAWHNARCPVHQIGYYQTQADDREVRRALMFERLRGLLDYLNMDPTEARETLVAIDECLALYTGSTPVLCAETSAMLCCGAEAADHVRDIEREHHRENRT